METRQEELRRGLDAFGITLGEEVLYRELSFLDELSRWSLRVNLTAIRDVREGLEKHLLDSLVLLKHVQGSELLDVGSGAGLPAIPLAIAKSEMQVFSVESIGKKISFQKHIRRTFGLKNLTPLNLRVEDLARDKKYSTITARAFAPIDKILGLTSPLLEEEGQLVLLRGSRDEALLPETIEALSRFDMQISKTETFQLPFSGAQRQILHIYRN